MIPTPSYSVFPSTFAFNATNTAATVSISYNSTSSNTTVNNFIFNPYENLETPNFLKRITSEKHEVHERAMMRGPKALKKGKKKWRKTFSIHLHQKYKRWKVKDFDYNSFLLGNTPHVTGFEALCHYFSQDVTAGYYIWNEVNDDMALLITHNKKLFDWTSYWDDIIITAIDFSWTMIFPNNRDIGPFFSSTEMIAAKQK